MEDVLDPDLPIVDPHHHLWDRRALLPHLPPISHPFEHVLRRTPRYLFDELLADASDGHNVRATVYLECGSYYRGDGPAMLAPVGETEFVNGVAAIAASGQYGPFRACAAIVGHADLTLGAAVEEVLASHLDAGGGRFRGIRQSASWDADASVLGRLGRAPKGLYLDARFREGFARLAPLGLSFDAWLLAPQLPDLIDLALAFPETTIVLDHVGTPLGIGPYDRAAGFAQWETDIRTLAACPNVNVKLGGLAMPFAGFASCLADPPASSAELAAEWKPYIDTCIDAFGPNRCMFESNFPVDALTCSYRTLWNAFKRLAAGASETEKAALFRETAARVYRIPSP